MTDFWQAFANAASVCVITVGALLAVACFGERRIGP